jgi:hypothetical protein
VAGGVALVEKPLEPNILDSELRATPLAAQGIEAEVDRKRRTKTPCGGALIIVEAEQKAPVAPGQKPPVAL